MDKFDPSKVLQVGMVLADGFPLMAYASAMEPLRAANLLSGRTLYRVRHLPVTGARSISSSGAVIGADAYVGEHVDFDLIVVIAGSDVASIESPQLKRWLRLLASRGVVIGGVSGGPLLLAGAGIMNGYRMTIHWDHAEALSSTSSRSIIERSLYVFDRDRLTCAGGAAALDMMHALITEHQGQAFAQKVSNWFLHTDIRTGEQPQRTGVASRHATTNVHLLTALEAMENHIADPLELEQIATLTGLSARHLTRLFQAHFDLSPLNFYRNLRLEKASQMLVQYGWSIQEISHATGFSSGAHLSRCFRQLFGVAPSEFRVDQNRSALS